MVVIWMGKSVKNYYVMFIIIYLQRERERKKERGLLNEKLENNNLL